MPRRAAFLFLFLFLPSLAHAAGQEDANKAQARELAQEAADLLDEKKYEEAIEKANRAEALYHAPFHVFVVASSLEGLGRLTEAAATYERLVAEPLPSSAPAVFKEAQATGQTRLRELLARIPTVLVRVRGASADQATATLDGEPLDVATGVATRANPGEHVVRVTAAGYRPFEQKLTLPNRGGVVLVDAKLSRETTDAPTGPTGPTSNNGESRDAGAGGRGAGLSSRTPAYAAFGLGGVGLVLGSITGGLELGKVSTFKERCPNGACPLELQGELDSARTLATISTVGFAVGGAGVVTGVVLLFVGKKAEAKTPGMRMQPWMSAEMVGVSGAF